MPKIDSLYELIKQKSQEKNRPLKIICDWDETIQPLKPAMIYEKMVDPDLSFGEFLKNFWENVTFAASPSGGSPGNRPEGDKRREIKSYSENFSGSKKEVDAIEEYEKEKLEMKVSPHKWDSYAKSFYGSEERFKVPFLSIAEDLLKAIKDGMVSELIIISAYNVGKPGQLIAIRKRNKQENTFGRLPITKIELTPQKKIREEGRTVSVTNLRWDIIRDKYSDFDLFIDDSQKAIKETKNYFPDRIYVLPDYKPLILQGKNIYHVKTTVSDLTDKDFVKAAEEYKAQKEQKLASRQAKQNQTEEREREREHLKATLPLLSFC